MQKYEEKTKETCQNGKKISQNGKICGNDKPKRPFYHLKYKKPQKNAPRHSTRNGDAGVPHLLAMRGIFTSLQ